MHETFLSQNSCLDVKDFLWFFCRDGTSKQKPKRTITFKNNWLRFQCSKIKYEDHFFSIRSIKSFIDQASSVKMAGYWPSSLFVFLWTSTSSWPIEMQKENLANIHAAILTSPLVNNKYLTNIFHVAVRLFSYRSQMTSKCGKNKKVAQEAQLIFYIIKN